MINVGNHSYCLNLSKIRVGGWGADRIPQASSTHHLDRQLNLMTKLIYIERNASLYKVSLYGNTGNKTTFPLISPKIFFKKI